MIANYATSDYHLPLSKSFRNAFNMGWEYFLNFIIVLTYFWMLLLMGIIVWLSFILKFRSFPKS